MFMLRLSATLLLFTSLVSISFAQEAPRFYGEEVVVTASRLPQLAGKSAWNTTVISKQELKNFKTVGDALRVVAGADSQAAGYYGAVDSVRLRGANSAQVLIMVDGRRINSPTLGMYDLNDLLVDNIEKIEIVRAPLSAIYGSDAISGAINIITRSPKETEKMLTVSSASFGFQQGKFSIGNSNFLILGDYIKSDGFRRNGDYLGRNVYGKFMFPLPVGQLLVDYGYYDALKGVPGLPTSEADPTSASTPDNRQTDKNTLAGVELQNENMHLKAYQSSLNQRSDSFSIWGASTYETQTQRTGIEWQQKIAQVAGNFLYGLEAREDKGKAPGMGEPTIRNYAVYLQEDIQLNDRYSLTASIRGDKHSTAGTSINPRLGIVYQPTDELTLRGSVGNAFRAPTLNDLYYSYNDGTYASYGDTSLKPEKSFSYELGLERKLTEGASARLSYYVSNINDLILWPEVATNEWRVKNVGEAYNEGVEFELLRKIGESGKGFINYTYQRAIDKKDVDPTAVDKVIPYSPQNKLNAGVILENSSIIVKYVGERFVDPQNEIKLAAYTVVDLALGKKMGGLQVDFSINNLFNATYFEAASKIFGTTTAMGYPMPGRTYALGVKWDL